MIAAALALVALCAPPEPLLAPPPTLAIPSAAPVSTGTKDLFVVQLEAPRARGEDPADPASVKVVAQVVRDHVGALQSCYEKMLKSQAIIGQAAIALEIGIDGRVTSTRVAENAVTDRAIAPCLARVIQRMRFGALPAPVTLTLPFRFAPAR